MSHGIPWLYHGYLGRWMKPWQLVSGPLHIAETLRQPFVWRCFKHISSFLHHHSFLASRHIVAQGAKLLSFQHQAVEVTQGKQDAPENWGATDCGFVVVAVKCPMAMKTTMEMSRLQWINPNNWIIFWKWIVFLCHVTTKAYVWLYLTSGFNACSHPYLDHFGGLDMWHSYAS